jgi:exonuclease VII small subunit
VTEKPDSYEVAVERLEQIIDRLDSGQAGLRETLDLCSEGPSWSPTAPPSSTRWARA